jgi:CDP-diacylglycerol--serine O-phosphatidyltransferase
MMLLPLLISFQWGPGDAIVADIVQQPWLVLTMTAITSVMMVSRLPTPSIKYMRLQREHRLAAGFCGGILAALLIAWPWATLTGALLIYVVTIPVAVYFHHPRTAALRARDRNCSAAPWT